MKRIITLILIVSISMSNIIGSVASAPKGLLILGDSISSGYGLDGYESGGQNSEILSFGNLLAEHLGFSSGEYANLAIDGQTTDGLYRSVSKMPNEVEGYDYITISIGGNDLIDSLMPAAISAIYQLSGGNYKEWEIKEKLTAFKEKMYSVIASVRENAGGNIEKILQILREKNPSSFIAIQTVYNPFDILNEKGYLAYINSMLISPEIDELNKLIKEIGERYNVYVIDTSREFKKDPAKYTNIKKADIHPSVEGHMEIYRLLLSAIAEFKAK